MKKPSGTEEPQPNRKEKNNHLHPIARDSGTTQKKNEAKSKTPNLTIETEKKKIK